MWVVVETGVHVMRWTNPDRAIGVADEMLARLPRQEKGWRWPKISPRHNASTGVQDFCVTWSTRVPCSDGTPRAVTASACLSGIFPAVSPLQCPDSLPLVVFGSRSAVAYTSNDLCGRLTLTEALNQPTQLARKLSITVSCKLPSSIPK